jgi:hypothetical protein
MIVDQGRIGSKIFYSNQASKYFRSLTPKRRGDVQGFVFSLLVVDEGLQLSLMMTSFVPLTSKPFDRPSKQFWESTSK